MSIRTHKIIKYDNKNTIKKEVLSIFWIHNEQSMSLTLLDFYRLRLKKGYKVMQNTVHDALTISNNHFINDRLQ